MITLFAASGTTGRRVAHALTRQGLSLRLAGRSPEKLAALAAELAGAGGAAPAWVWADARRPESLGRLFEDTHLLVNCAAPFTDLGEAVAARAALSGVHYLDTSNELGFVYRLRSYSELARRKGAILLPACGFEVALADCAAALLAQRLPGALDEVSVVYTLRGTGASAGSRRSAIRSLATSWITYQDGTWRGSLPGGRVQRWALPGGKRHALTFPSCESVTLPAHLTVGAVNTWLSVSPGARFWAPLVIPLFAWLARGALGRLLLHTVGVRGKERRGDSFDVYVCARRGAQGGWINLHGQAVYDLTAEIVAYAAGVLLHAPPEGGGLLAPAQALNPGDFLAWVQRQGVRCEEGPLD